MKPLVVVMGVSASGKSLVGARLANRLGVSFRDGDDLHPAANIEKMRAGVSLSDADRSPWLDMIAGWIKAHALSGGVVTCSALKSIYRDRLRTADRRLRFLFLAVDAATLRERMAARHDHFMPATLLVNQLDTLEPPNPDEHDVLAVDGAIDPALIVRRFIEWLKVRPNVTARP